MLPFKSKPDQIMVQAQILEAFELSKPERQDASSRMTRGVRAVSIGNASESYDNAVSSLNPETFGILLLSVRAYRLVRPYLRGSAVIV